MNTRLRLFWASLVCMGAMAASASVSAQNPASASNLPPGFNPAAGLTPEEAARLAALEADYAARHERAVRQNSDNLGKGPPVDFSVDAILAQMGSDGLELERLGEKRALASRVAASALYERIGPIRFTVKSEAEKERVEAQYPDFHWATTRPAKDGSFVMTSMRPGTILWGVPKGLGKTVIATPAWSDVLPVSFGEMKLDFTAGKEVDEVISRDHITGGSLLDCSDARYFCSQSTSLFNMVIPRACGTWRVGTV